MTPCSVFECVALAALGLASAILLLYAPLSDWRRARARQRAKWAWWDTPEEKAVRAVKGPVILPDSDRVLG